MFCESLTLHQGIQHASRTRSSITSRAVRGRTKSSNRSKNHPLRKRDASPRRRPRTAPQTFRPDYYSRNPIAINWNEEARPPRSSSGILAPFRAYDSSLFLRYAGNILLTGNVAQSILILVGAGGTSKSTLCEIIELVMGTDNFIELRTNSFTNASRLDDTSARHFSPGKMCREIS